MKRLIPVILGWMFKKVRKILFIFFGALLYILYGSLGNGLLIAPASAASPSGWTPPPTELLIIVPYKEPSDETRQVNEEWIAEGRRLRNYKQTSRLGAVIKTLNEINRDYEGRDEPERIKRAIHEYALDPGIKYVMLVGDAKIMPVRYQYTGYTTDGATFYSSSEGYCRDRYCDENGTNCADYCTEHPSYCDGEGHIRWCPYEAYGFVPNDGYYANLWNNDDLSKEFDDWDRDGDGFFGELYRDNYRGIDGHTMHPDVVVGRVPVRTPEEFGIFIDKIMAYENGIDGMRRSDAYRKVLLTASNSGSANHYLLGEELGSSYDITYLTTLEGDTFSIQHPDGSEETTSTPAPFMSEFINTNTPHFVGYGGHGSQICWCDMGFGWRHAVGLTNELPVIAAAASCSTAKLADPLWYLEPPPVSVTSSETPAYTMADAFLGGSNGGAVVYVGAVTTSRGGANHLERRFFRAIKDGARTAGDAWLNAVEGYIAYHNLDLLSEADWHDDSTHPNGGYWIGLTLGDYNRMHFFGDPSLRRYGEEGWDGPSTTRARYVRRVHIDPDSRYQRIVFDTVDRESDATTTRYRYRTGESWSPWLSGSEFYLPFPTSPTNAKCEREKSICEAVVEYYSVDRSGNRETVKAARIVYEYPKVKELKKPSSKIKGASSPSKLAGFKVKGRVVDEKGRPLRATLTLNNNAKHRETQTDAQGWYVFSAVQSGNYDLRITHAPTGYRQFTPDDSSYKIVVQRSSVERGFVFVREDHVEPTMTQELPWNVVANSGCVYGLAYDDWYGTGVEDVKLGITDIRNRWLSPKQIWVDKETWFTPDYVMSLNDFLETDLSKKLSGRLSNEIQKTEKAQLEPLACRLAADCKPLVWVHCLNDPGLLSKGSKVVRGKVKDRAGNMSKMEAMDVEVVADFDASPIEGVTPLTIKFTNKSRGNVIDVEWDFGDSKKSISFHPTHTYKTPGTYTVTLLISGLNSWQTETKEIRVTTKDKQN